MAAIFPPPAQGGVPPGSNVENGYTPSTPVIGEGPYYIGSNCNTALTDGQMNAITSELLAALDKLGIAFDTGKLTNLGDALAMLRQMIADIPLGITQEDADQRYVWKAGDIMTGLLQLSGDPIEPLHAVTKQYFEAPANDLVYGRRNELWVPIEAGGDYVVPPVGSEGQAGSLEIATDAEIRSAASGPNAIIAQKLETAAAFVPLADAPTVLIDWDKGINFALECGGNALLANPTNPQAGTYRTILAKGTDATARTINFDSDYFGMLPVIADLSDTQWYLITIFCISEHHFVVSGTVARIGAQATPPPVVIGQAPEMAGIGAVGRTDVAVGNNQISGLTLPLGYQPGDYLVMPVAAAVLGVVPEIAVPPSGWTLIATGKTTTVAPNAVTMWCNRVLVYGKYAVANEPVPIIEFHRILVPGQPTGIPEGLACIASFRNVDPAIPYENASMVEGIGSYLTGITGISFPSATTTGPNRRVLTVVGWCQDTGVSEGQEPTNPAPTSGWSEIMEFHHRDAAFVLNDQTLIAAGTVSGSEAFTGGMVWSAASLCFSLRPKPPAQIVRGVSR